MVVPPDVGKSVSRAPAGVATGNGVGNGVCGFVSRAPAGGVGVGAGVEPSSEDDE